MKTLEPRASEDARPAAAGKTRRAPGLVLDLMALLGGGLIGWGCWCIYPPAGWIAVGILLLAAAVYGASKR